MICSTTNTGCPKVPFIWRCEASTGGLYMDGWRREVHNHPRIVEGNCRTVSIFQSGRSLEASSIHFGLSQDNSCSKSHNWLFLIKDNNDSLCMKQFCSLQISCPWALIYIIVGFLTYVFLVRFHHLIWTTSVQSMNCFLLMCYLSTLKALAWLHTWIYPDFPCLKIL